MSALSRILGGPLEVKAMGAAQLGPLQYPPSYRSKAGVMVTPARLLRLSTVLACVRVLAEGLAQLPRKVLREDESGRKTVQRKHPVHRVLARKPNSWMTGFQFIETLMYWAVLGRGGHAVIVRSSDAERRVLELLPVPPTNIAPVTTGQPWGYETFRVFDSRGTIGTYARSEIFHVEGPSWDSVQSMEMAEQMREAAGLALALEESQALLQANGAQPSGIVSTDKTLSEPAAKRIKAMLVDESTGERKHGIPVLDNGVKFQSMAMTAADAQTLEERKLQIEECARMLRVFPQMIGYADKTATYASAEQFFMAHVVHCLGPWIARWEESIDRDLFTEPELDDGYTAKFFTTGLLRGDAAARSAYYKAGLGTASSPGWLSPNDVRRLEDMDPDPAPAADRIVTVEDLSGKGAPSGAGGVPPAE